jgi:hypothetical protein
MKQLGRLHLFAAAILVVLLSAACGAGSNTEGTRTTIAGDWPIWDSVDGLGQDADIVVIGTVGRFIDLWQVTESDGSVTKTDAIHDFAVDDVLKGDETMGGDTISVGYWLFDDPNVTPFIEGERLLLFLDGFDWGGKHDGWVPLGSDSGVFEVAGTTATARGEVGPMAGTRIEIADLRADLSG